MIKSLYINNYALLKDSFINFNKGFSVISGDTGAGKSILLDALCLLLGKRFERNNAQEPSSKSVIEAVFILNHTHKKFFLDNDLDFEEETVVRREIRPNGKSRTFINDTPVLLSILSDFGAQVVEIFAQGQFNLLTEQKSQLNFIDQFSNSQSHLLRYQQIFREFNQLKKDLEIIQGQGNLSESELDFLKFQYQEITTANIALGEKEELESNIKLLENVEEIRKSIYEIDLLLNNENGVLGSLVAIRKKISAFDNLSSLSKRVESVEIELNDISEELDLVKTSLNIDDPEKLKKMYDRLDTINNLLHKYRLNFIEQLIELKNDIHSRFELSQSFEILLKEKKQEISLKEIELKECLIKLNNNRSKVLSKISNEVVNVLNRLGMPFARFNIDVKEKEVFDIYGNTDISFMFSANKGRSMQEVAKIASGGELSRLMLALKYINSQNTKINTLIFDEIDSGVSGEVASLMADMMNNISLDTQLIAISHLPQIASRADNHLKVQKYTLRDSTESKVIELDGKQRVKEIAKLLSGKNLTQSALDNAVDLLNQ